MALFSDEEFEQVCSELDTPDTEGYELFTESHDVKIYRLYNETSGLYEYKIYGGLDVAPEKCIKVYMDVPYRRKWDSYVVELEEIRDGDKEGLYWQINFPFPMSNRDYTYRRELREMDIGSGHKWVVLAKSDEFRTRPPRSGVIRVAEYMQSMAITSDNVGGTKAYMCYYDNPGGMIPTWLINWAAKTGVPGFLGTMQEACRGYDDYLKKAGSS